MKTKYIFASLLVSSLAVTGCQDMDTLPDGGIVTDSQKETVSTLNPERGVAKVNAIFSTFNQAFPNSSALGAERHNDIGYPTVTLSVLASAVAASTLIPTKSIQIGYSFSSANF